MKVHDWTRYLADAEGHSRLCEAGFDATLPLSVHHALSFPSPDVSPWDSTCLSFEVLFIRTRSGTFHQQSVHCWLGQRCSGTAELSAITLATSRPDACSPTHAPRSALIFINHCTTYKSNIRCSTNPRSEKPKRLSTNPCFSRSASQCGFARSPC